MVQSHPETGVTYGAKPKIILREEQQACIDKTKRVFNRGDRMLWDCKMRFGKTITAYSLVKNMGYKKVLVVTHRPAVVDGWRTDFSLIFQDDHVFLTKANIKEEDRFTAADASIDAENDRILLGMGAFTEKFPCIVIEMVADEGDITALQNVCAGQNEQIGALAERIMCHLVSSLNSILL